MNIKTLFLIVLVFSYSCSIKNKKGIESPDKSINVQVSVSDDGTAVYSVRKSEKLIIEESKLGLKREDADFTHNLKLLSISGTKKIEDTYTLNHGKQSTITYAANKSIYHFENSDGEKMDIIFQVSDDGVAFRYYFPEVSDSDKIITEETTSFKFPAKTKAWLQPCADAKTGWAKTNPSYEEYYLKDISVGTPSPTQAGWVYPALFNTGDSWVLISESGLNTTNCGTRLKKESPNGEYAVGFPESQEKILDGGVLPESRLPWYSPWRIIVVGSLNTIVESTLVTDVAPATIEGDFSWVKPGRASWSWVLLGDQSVTFTTQKKFIDYASEMGWEYCLIDGLWDQQIGYDSIQILADYATSKNVGLFLWYNSAGDWNTTYQTPKNKMLTHESRMEEFTRLKKMGIKGMKIDFFGGDGQSVIQYYHAIMKDAADAGLMVVFHGCTLPRGWQRTYPNLMSMEAVKGMEFITFEQENADNAPSHCAMLPFVRNVFDPMDFTPVCFSELNGIERKTSNGFELALSVLFTSGIQHYAETPSGMEKVPAYVKNILKDIPVNWDETRFIDGFPGKYIVIARKTGNVWYIAGINAEEEAQELTLDLSFVNGLSGIIIQDGNDNRSFEQTQINSNNNNQSTFTLKKRGGFLMKFD